MSKLLRQPDGSYRGTHKGREFTVHKEMVPNRGMAGQPGEVWVARAGPLVVNGRKHDSRADVV